MSWPTMRLQAAAEVRLGRQRSPENAEGSFMVPYLRAANVKDGYLALDDVKSMNFSPSEQVVFSLRPGDVLVTEGSGSLTSVGASAVWAGEIAEEVCFQNTLLRLRPRRGVDGRFLAWWARSAFGAGILASVASGVNIYHLSADRVRALDVQVPPIREQQRIADFLEVETRLVDKYVSLQSRARSVLLERRAASVLREISGQGKSEQRSSDIPWLESLPKEWNSGKITYFARMGSGHTPSRSKPEWWFDCSVPWITTGEVAQVRSDRQEKLIETRECISHVGIENSSAEICPAGSVVLCRTAASAGFSAVMGRDMATSQDFATWTCGPRLDPYYLLWCLRAMRFDLLGRLAFGSTHKTIYMPDLQALRIPLPSVEEQQEIVARIRKMNWQVDELLDKIDRQLELLAERRQALITAAVTGQIDVSTARGVSA